VSLLLNRIQYCVVCLARPACRWSCDDTSCQKLCPVCCSNSLQSTAVSSDYSRIQLSPFGSFRRAWNPLGYHTYPEIPASMWAADSVRDFPVLGHPLHQEYQYHRQPTSTLSPIGVSDCHGVRHVTSSLPVTLGPTSRHARLPGRDQLFVGDYRYLPYQPAVMRTDSVPFPVPVEASYKPSNQHGDVLLSDDAVQRVEYNATMAETRHGFSAVTMQVRPFYFYYYYFYPR